MADERGGAVNRTGDRPEAGDAGGVRLALLEPSADSDAAALEGVLQVEGRCLYVVQPGGAGARTMPAFLIAGARWDAERNLLLAHGKSFAPAQRVSLGGSMASDRSLLRWVQPPDPSCDTASIFVTGSIDVAPEPAAH